MEVLGKMFRRGDFDLVAIGRAILADPAWAAKVRESDFSELNPFTPDVLKTLA
jgi:2,4-dienoyl-CoA reductase-like NADH-dependent reductase (Old Yellow Enzyme family)